MGGGKVGVGEEVGWGRVGDGTASVITQRCRPSLKSLSKKPTVSSKQSADALKKRSHPLRRSLMMMRKVPCSPARGTNRNKVLSVSFLMVASFDKPSLHVDELLDGLPRNHSLRTLELCWNELNEVDALLSIVWKCPQLKALNLLGNRITDIKSWEFSH